MKYYLLLLTFIGVLFTSNAQSFDLQFDHTALSVSDLDKSAAFYHDILQLHEIPTPASNPTLRWFDLGNNHQLHLIKSDAKSIEKTPKALHFSVHLADIDAFVAYLDKNKVDYINWLGDSKETSLRPDGVRQIYVQDPDGYWIEINDASYLSDQK
ncbi:MAG: VOC family protein [Leeuwenhoekiella sp.]